MDSIDLVHCKHNGLSLSFMHWKIADLSLGGNSSKSLWHLLSGGSESKCPPGCQSFSWPQHNFIQVGIKSVCYSQQTLFYTRDSSLTYQKPATQRWLHVLLCVCVLFCNYLTTSGLLTPGKEGFLSGRLQQRSACGYWTHSVGGVLGELFAIKPC